MCYNCFHRHVCDGFEWDAFLSTRIARNNCQPVNIADISYNQQAMLSWGEDNSTVMQILSENSKKIKNKIYPKLIFKKNFFLMLFFKPLEVLTIGAIFF